MANRTCSVASPVLFAGDPIRDLIANYRTVVTFGFDDRILGQGEPKKFFCGVLGI